MSPMFDPETFMQQVIDAPLETDFSVVPSGEYQATIDDFTSDAFERIDFEYKKGPRAGTPGTMTKFTLPFVIQDDTLKTELGRDKLVVTQQLILDVDNDGGLDWGKNKNIALGRIRSAVGQNSSGPWSIAQLRGAGPVMVKVAHTQYDRRDGTKGTRVEVERVARIA